MVAAAKITASGDTNHSADSGKGGMRAGRKQDKVCTTGRARDIPRMQTRSVSVLAWVLAGKGVEL